MRADALRQAARLKPWKPLASEVPHLTIETNFTCNAACRSCYNRDRQTVKTLAEVTAEIDRGLELRRADAVTLVGGEPTLHPDLPRIVRHVSSKGVTCQLLTNGRRLLDDDGATYLDRLRACGLARLLLHVDEGQPHVHGRPIETAERLLRLCAGRGLLCSLSWTIYPDGAPALPALVRALAPYPHFDGLLLLLEKNCDESVRPGHSRPVPRMEEAYAALSSTLGIEPSLYLPSSLDDRDVCWLFFFSYYNVATGRSFAISPELARAFQRVARLLTGREAFGQTPARSHFALSLVATLAAELARAPRRFGEALRLWRASRAGRDLRFHYIVVQDGPEYDCEKQAVRLCYHCPDATMRAGRLTPVCLADRVRPLAAERPTPPAFPALQEVIDGHLS